MQLIKSGYESAFSNDSLNTYLSEYKIESFSKQPLDHFLEELKKSFLEKYSEALESYIIK